MGGTSARPLPPAPPGGVGGTGAGPSAGDEGLVTPKRADDSKANTLPYHSSRCLHSAFLQCSIGIFCSRSKCTPCDINRAGPCAISGLAARKICKW